LTLKVSCNDEHISVCGLSVCVAGVASVALVAELRMLSSGESSSAMVSNTTVVKSEPAIKSDSETLMPSLVEPGMLLHEAFPESVLTALMKLVFDEPAKLTDSYRWKSLGYWLCCQMMSLLKSSDIFSQTVALKMLSEFSTAFLDNLHHGIRQRYFITYSTFVCYKTSIAWEYCISALLLLPLLSFHT